MTQSFSHGSLCSAPPSPAGAAADLDGGEHDPADDAAGDADEQEGQQLGECAK